ncbi:creatininase family protein [Streptomyces stramineus]
MTAARAGARSYTDLTSAETAGALGGHTLVWPIGATEQHGPHLPLSVDSVLAEEFGRAIAEELDGFVLPVQPVAARSLPQSGGGCPSPARCTSTATRSSASCARRCSRSPSCPAPGCWW